jgi:hypothetical protein
MRPHPPPPPSTFHSNSQHQGYLQCHACLLAHVMIMNMSFVSHIFWASQASFFTVWYSFKAIELLNGKTQKP